MSAHFIERERALRQLADLCSLNNTAHADCAAAGRRAPLSGISAEGGAGGSSDGSDAGSSCDASASSAAAAAGGSPSSHMGSPSSFKRAPLVRPTEIKRRNRKRQVPGETQTDVRRLAKRARARQNAQRRLQAILGAHMYCHACGTTETPEWRRGPDGNKSLCNACGLHFAKIVRTERERREAAAEAPVAAAAHVARMAVTALLN